MDAGHLNKQNPAGCTGRLGAILLIQRGGRTTGSVNQGPDPGDASRQQAPEGILLDYEEQDLESR